MAKLNRLLGLAAQALEKHSASQRGDDQYSNRPAATPRSATASRGGSARAAASVSDADRAAVARYDYLMQTADPHRVEQIHREAFARLTPAQRDQVGARMGAELPPSERPASTSPDDLARAAGRAEAARPGRMRTLLARAGGVGAVGAVGGAGLGILGAVAGGAVLSSVAGPLLDQAAGLGVDFESLAQGLDVEALVGGVDVEGLAGGIDTEGLTSAGEGLLGSAGEVTSGLGETVSGWGERLGDLGIPGLGDLFRK